MPDVLPSTSTVPCLRHSPAPASSTTPTAPARRPLHPPPHRPGHHRLVRYPADHRHPPLPQLPHRSLTRQSPPSKILSANCPENRMSSPSTPENSSNSHRINHFPSKNSWHSSYAPLDTLNIWIKSIEGQLRPRGDKPPPPVRTVLSQPNKPHRINILPASPVR